MSQNWNSLVGSQCVNCEMYSSVDNSGCILQCCILQYVFVRTRLAQLSVYLIHFAHNLYHVVEIPAARIIVHERSVEKTSGVGETTRGDISPI